MTMTPMERVRLGEGARKHDGNVFYLVCSLTQLFTEQILINTYYVLISILGIWNIEE